VDARGSERFQRPPKRCLTETLTSRGGDPQAGAVEPGAHGGGAQVLLSLLLENEQIDRDPALVLRTPKKREALPDVLDRREVVRLRSDRAGRRLETKP
jgi:hypothetical protein